MSDEPIEIPESSETMFARGRIAGLLEGQVTDNFALADAIDLLITCKLADFIEFAADRFASRAPNTTDTEE